MIEEPKLVSTARTFEEAVEEYKDGMQLEDGGRWVRVRAAMKVLDTTIYGQGRMDKFAKRVGLAKATVYQDARIGLLAKKFTRVDFSPRMYQEALSAEELGPDEPVRVLELAEGKGWSTRELAEYIKEQKALATAEDGGPVLQKDEKKLVDALARVVGVSDPERAALAIADRSDAAEILHWHTEYVDALGREFRSKVVVREGSTVITDPHKPNNGDSRVVGLIEHSNQRISPFDRAILGHRPGDIAVVKAPQGCYEVEIIEVDGVRA